MCVQVVGQYALRIVQIGLEHDFVVQPGRVCASDDLIQPDGVCGQRITPIKAVQRDCGVVPDILEGIADLLARYDLCVAALADRHIGINALIQVLNLHDLAFMLQIDRHLFIADRVELGAGNLFHGIAAQRQRL